MTNLQIKLKCAEISNTAAGKIGLNFEGRTEEPFIIVAEKIYSYVTEKGADTDLRLSCANMALQTVNKRGFMGDLLFTKIKKIEQYVTNVSNSLTKDTVMADATVPAKASPRSTSK